MVEKLFFEMLRCSVTGESLPSETTEYLKGDMQQAILRLAKKHDLSHLIAKVLTDSNCAMDQEVKERYFSYQMSALMRREQANYDYEKLISFFAEQQIVYVPLKGAIICRYYPEPWMRTSCDIDILVKEELVEQIANKMVGQLGYTRQTKTYHDISLISPYGTHVELHFSIQENEEGIDRLLSKAWEYIEPTAACSTAMRFTNEYFLFHLYAHMAYHFLHGGCGVRPFLDLWILRKKMAFSEEKLIAMCKEAEISRFYSCVNETLEVWFENKQENALHAAIRSYVFNGGVYGTVENRIAVQRSKLGKKSFVLSRLWLSREELRTSYPCLDRYPILLPFCQAGRWYHALISGRIKRSKTEMRIHQSLSESQLRSTAELLKCLELS